MIQELHGCLAVNKQESKRVKKHRDDGAKMPGKKQHMNQVAKERLNGRTEKLRIEEVK